MKKKFLINRRALLARESAASWLLGVCALLERRTYVGTLDKFAGAIVIYRSTAERFTSMRWSSAG
jgi:hypothetical protein